MKTEYRALSSKVLVVAVEGAIGDWAAYIDAVPGNNHDNEFFEVAEHGAKLDRHLAEILFPKWKHLTWRK